jgi:hypothetical protein
MIGLSSSAVTPRSVAHFGVHDLIITKEAPNYRLE